MHKWVYAMCMTESHNQETELLDEYVTTQAAWSQEEDDTEDFSETDQPFWTWHKVLILVALQLAIGVASLAVAIVVAKNNGPVSTDAHLPMRPYNSTPITPTQPRPPMTHDQQFVDALLRAQHVTHDQERAVVAAHWVCQQLDAHFSRPAIIRAMQDGGWSDPHRPGSVALSEYQLDQFITLSALYYCPDLSGR